RCVRRGGGNGECDSRGEANKTSPRVAFHTRERPIWMTAGSIARSVACDDSGDGATWYHPAAPVTGLNWPPSRRAAVWHHASGGGTRMSVDLPIAMKLTRRRLTALSLAGTAVAILPLTRGSRGALAQSNIVITMVTDTAGLGDQNFNDLANKGG